MVIDNTEKFLVYLNMLHTLSVSEKARRTQSAIISIVDLLNYEYCRQNEVVTLGEEIAHARKLVHIFKERFGNKLNFVEHIEDKVLNLYVPHYTVMAFVENSLNHGLELKEGSWELELTVSLTDESILITIKDNGMGFNTDLITSETKTGINSMGSIKNVSSRLKSYSNGLSKVQIHSSPGSGTTVIITLPV